MMKVSVLIPLTIIGVLSVACDKKEPSKLIMKEKEVKEESNFENKKINEVASLNLEMQRQKFITELDASEEVKGYLIDLLSLDYATEVDRAAYQGIKRDIISKNDEFTDNEKLHLSMALLPGSEGVENIKKYLNIFFSDSSDSNEENDTFNIENDEGGEAVLTLRSFKDKLNAYHEIMSGALQGLDSKMLKSVATMQSYISNSIVALYSNHNFLNTIKSMVADLKQRNDEKIDEVALDENLSSSQIENKVLEIEAETARKIEEVARPKTLLESNPIAAMVATNVLSSTGLFIETEVINTHKDAILSETSILETKEGGQKLQDQIDETSRIIEKYMNK